MAESNPTRLPELDLLRFVAALAVVLYHYVTCFPAPPDAALAPLKAVSAVTRYGYLGVDLFFMISGFVILWSSMNRDALGFTVSRISRLYPSFWASMVLIVICAVTLGPAVASYSAPPLDVWTIVANATMVPALLDAKRLEDVYWTLQIEVQFYALIFVLLLVRQIRNVEPWLYLWLAVSIVGLFVEFSRVARFVTLHPYGSFFVAGCLFFLVRSDGLNWRRGLGLGASGGTSVYVSLEQRAEFITVDAASDWVVPGLILAFYGVFAMLALRPGPSRLPPIAHQLGELTYPLYLTHATLGSLTYQLLRPRFGLTATLLLIIALSLAVAWVVTHTIDRPARKPLANLLYRCAAAIRIYKPIVSEPAK